MSETHNISEMVTVKAPKKVMWRTPYSGVQIEKLERVGHVQKRIGSHLRRLKRTTKVRNLKMGSSSQSTVD